MANSKEKEWERRALRHWSPHDNDWVAPPPEEGGPDIHNAATYSNWHCRCLVCKAENYAKWLKQEEGTSLPEQRSQSLEQASAPHSSDASSAGGGATEKASSRAVRKTGTSGLARVSTSHSRSGTVRARLDSSTP